MSKFRYNAHTITIVKDIADRKKKQTKKHLSRRKNNQRSSILAIDARRPTVLGPVTASSSPAPGIDTGSAGTASRVSSLSGGAYPENGGQADLQPKDWPARGSIRGGEGDDPITCPLRVTGEDTEYKCGPRPRRSSIRQKQQLQ